MVTEDTLTDKLKCKLKNNKLIAILCVFGAIVIGLSAFTDASQKLWKNISSLIYGPDKVYANALVYRSRPEIKLSEELGNAKIAWFAWHTGTTQLSSKQYESTHPIIQKMILIHPESVALKSLAILDPKKALFWKESIRQLSQDVTKDGGSVRWFDGPIQNSMIIANPESEDGWARIEMLLPFQASDERPSVYVTKKNDPELFNKLKKTFLEIWDKSAQITYNPGR